jgi:hypothetical protein
MRRAKTECLGIRIMYVYELPSHRLLFHCACTIQKQPSKHVDLVQRRYHHHHHHHHHHHRRRRRRRRRRRHLIEMLSYI